MTVWMLMIEDFDPLTAGERILLFETAEGAKSFVDDEIEKFVINFGTFEENGLDLFQFNDGLFTEIVSQEFDEAGDRAKTITFDIKEVNVMS